MSGAAAGAAAATVVLIADAIKASGVVVRVEASEFLKILARIDAPLVVHAPPGTFTLAQRYLTSHKGLAFFTKSIEPLDLPARTELVEARSISAPW